MSDRSFKLPDVTPFTTLLASIDVLAVKCALVMKTALPAEYHGRRTSIGLIFDTTIASSDGSSERYRSDPLTVTGWNLLTMPYFISDTRNEDFRPAVFTVNTGCEPTVISRESFENRGRHAHLFPRADDLQDVHRELSMILAPPRS